LEGSNEKTSTSLFAFDDKMKNKTDESRPSLSGATKKDTLGKNRRLAEE